MFGTPTRSDLTETREMDASGGAWRRAFFFRGRPLEIRIGFVAALLFVLPLLTVATISSWSSKTVERMDMAEEGVRIARTVAAVAHPALPPVALVEGLVNGEYVSAALMGSACAASPSLPAEPVCAALDGWDAAYPRVEVGGRTLIVTAVARGGTDVIVARDVTALADLSAAHRRLAAFVVSGFFVLGLAGLILFLRYEFGALTAIVDLLRAYSRGDAGARPGRLTTAREVTSLYSSAQEVQRAQEDRRQYSILATRMDAAAKIQRSILPEPLALPGSCLAGRMTPADMVGGDFYDWFPTGPNRVAFAVADVSDKGLGSAMVGVQADSALRAMFADGGDPGEALVRLNDLLSDRNPELMFTTMILAEVDLPTGRVRFASAGHEPPIVVRADGSTSFVGHDGDTDNDPALALFPGASYATHEVVLGPGDTFFLYTDGANEARVAGGHLLGRPALARIAGRCAGMRADRMIDGVEAAVLEAIAPNRPDDDLTFVALSIEGGFDG